MNKFREGILSGIIMLGLFLILFLFCIFSLIKCSKETFEDTMRKYDSICVEEQHRKMKILNLVNCPTCHYTFEVKKEDIQKIDTSYFVICPNCNIQNEVLIEKYN